MRVADGKKLHYRKKRHSAGIAIFNWFNKVENRWNAIVCILEILSYNATSFLTLPMLLTDKYVHLTTYYT